MLLLSLCAADAVFLLLLSAKTFLYQPLQGFCSVLATLMVYTANSYFTFCAVYQVIYSISPRIIDLSHPTFLYSELVIYEDFITVYYSEIQALHAVVFMFLLLNFHV